MTLDHELRSLDSMKLTLWLTSKTPSCELTAPEVIHNLRLSMTRKTPGHELRVVDAIQSLGLSMT